MRAALNALAGAGLTVIACWSLGRLLLNGLKIRLRRQEEWPFSFVTGAACLSLLVCALAAVHQARKGAFVALTLVAAGAVVWRGAFRLSAERLPPVRRLWWLLFLPFGVLYLVNALAPEISPIGADHLGRVAMFWRARGIATEVPQAMEMLYLFAFSIGRHSGAALVHLAYLIALALAMLCYGRRIGTPGAGAFGAFLVFASPVVGVTGAAASDEVALACVLFLIFYLAQVWSEQRDARLLFLAGLLIVPWLTRNWDLGPVLQLLPRSPMKLTVLGDSGGGFLGPVFLLAPLALVALRRREGRRLLLAVLLVGSTCIYGGTVRSLIPLAPFIALALGLALAQSPGIIPLVALTHAVWSWPDVATIYSAWDAWRLREIPVRAALRIESEHDYLWRTMAPAYRWACVIEELVPPGERVFTLGVPARSYTSRQVVAASESATLSEILQTPFTEALQARRNVRFTFPAQAAQRLRLEWNAAGKAAGYSVTELRVFHGGKEVERWGPWRLTANANPREVQFAFDNSYVTRWSSRRAVFAGMFLEVDSGSEVLLDAVQLEAPSAMTDHPAVVLHNCGPPEVAEIPERPGLRQAAMLEFKSRGIRYLLIRDTDRGADDFRENAMLWGITPLRWTNDARIYRVD